jgi:hypothetical protein
MLRPSVSLPWTPARRCHIALPMGSSFTRKKSAAPRSLSTPVPSPKSTWPMTVPVTYTLPGGSVASPKPALKGPLPKLRTQRGVPSLPNLAMNTARTLPLSTVLPIVSTPSWTPVTYTEPGSSPREPWTATACG